MNEIRYTQGMWQEMNTYYNNTYRLQFNLYNEIVSLGRTLSGMADEVIIIHRPDKLSPRKKIMKHTMD